jgi:hypothetical protein
MVFRGGGAPSPFRGCAAPSLSRREREKTPQAAKGEDDAGVNDWRR